MKRYYVTQTLSMCREGWRGAWDAVKAAEASEALTAQPMMFCITLLAT
jgi:hypothetical protein